VRRRAAQREDQIGQKLLVRRETRGLERRVRREKRGKRFVDERGRPQVSVARARRDEVAPRAAGEHRAGLLQQVEQLDARYTRAPCARRVRPTDHQGLRRQRKDRRDRVCFGLLKDDRNDAQRGHCVARGNGVEQITHRLARLHTDDGRHRRLVDLSAAGEADQFVELDLQLRQFGTHRVLKQLDRALRDRRLQIVLDIVADPLRNSRADERLELDRRERALQLLVDFGPRWRDEHQQQVRRRALEILVEHGARFLLERARVAYHDNPTIGHHRWCADDGSERLGVELGAAECLIVEIARCGIDRGGDQLAKLFFFDVVVFAVEIVHRREGAGLRGGSQHFDIGGG